MRFNFASALALAAGSLIGPAMAQGPNIQANIPSHLNAAKSEKLSDHLLSLDNLYKAHLSRLAQAKASGAALPTFVPQNLPVMVKNEQVVIDAVAKVDPALLKAELEQLGLQNGRIFGAYVSGLLPLSSISRLANVASLHFAHPSFAVINAGSVQSEGDAAMKANIARTEFYNVDGRGLNVGVLSDSYNCLGGAATDIGTGDLPAGGVNVLAEQNPCTGGTDEGRAMLQIVHDVAPGSGLAFHTAFNGMADFAQGIIDLANPAKGNAKVIVDDVIYFGEPMFQDGIVAQAVDQVKAAGVAYFSSANNQGRRSYESAFNVVNGASGSCWWHNFAGDSGVNYYQSVTIPTGGYLQDVLQWDSPFFSVSGAPGSQNDLDLYVYNQSSQIVASSASNNLGGDPLEIVFYQNSTGQPLTVFLAICKYSPSNTPTPGKIKMVSFGNETVNYYATNSSTNFGHSNAAGAVAVGASYWGTPLTLEYFSSAGGTPILFDIHGSPTGPIVRNKPEIVAPDGVHTTFFYGSSHTFYGTSAAAPHAAAVAALMANSNPAVTPSQIYTAMDNTATDMGTAGFDYDTGFGFIQANKAVEAVATLTRGDVTRDGKIDSTDINLILAGRGPAAGPKDARDVDANLTIDNADARLATAMCSKPRCAP